MPQTTRISQRTLVIAGIIVAIAIALMIFGFAASRGLLMQRASLALTAGTAPSDAGFAYDSLAVGMPDKRMAVESAGSDMYYPSPMPPVYPTGGETAAEVDQKIIKNGSLRLTVASVSDAISRLTSIAKSRDGFVQDSSSSERGDGTHEGQITIRIPATDFEATMNDAKALAKVVNYEAATGQDVTEQFTDLQAQLRNAKAQETEYLRILQRAVSVQDVLLVQQQLSQIRGQIESFEGRIKYLENLTSYSTVTVALAEETSVTLPTKEFRLGEIIRASVQQLIMIGQAIIAGVIWVVIVGGGVAIPLILLAAIIWAAIRTRRRP